MIPTPPRATERAGARSNEVQIPGEQLLEQVKQLIQEGNVRRLIVKHAGQTVVELPLTVEMGAAALALMLAAVGTIGARVAECTIEVERHGSV